MKYELAPIRKDSNELFRKDKLGNYIFNLKISGDNGFVMYINECKLIDKSKKFIEFPKRSWPTGNILANGKAEYKDLKYFYMPQEEKDKVEQMAINYILGGSNNNDNLKNIEAYEQEKEKEFEEVDFIFN